MVCVCVCVANGLKIMPQSHTLLQAKYFKCDEQRIIIQILSCDHWLLKSKASVFINFEEGLYSMERSIL